VRLVSASPEHIPCLAANMREADAVECRAFGRSPEQALDYSLRSSLWALTAIDDEPVAMLGVSPKSMIESVGVPWMLGTEEVYANGRALLSLSRPVFAEMADSFDVLENLVAAENERAIRFLRWAGFTMGEEPVDVGGTAFLHFERR